MECARCKAHLVAESAVTHGADVVCEDCLMDLLSPAKACDPWAVKLAKGSMATSPAAEAALQGLERALLDLVRSRGAVPKPEAARLLRVRQVEVDRAFAVLRHMELLRARRVEGAPPSTFPSWPPDRAPSFELPESAPQIRGVGPGALEASPGPQRPSCGSRT